MDWIFVDECNRVIEWCAHCSAQTFICSTWSEIKKLNCRGDGAENVLITLSHSHKNETYCEKSMGVNSVLWIKRKRLGRDVRRCLKTLCTPSFWFTVKMLFATFHVHSSVHSDNAESKRLHALNVSRKCEWHTAFDWWTWIYALPGYRHTHTHTQTFMHPWHVWIPSHNIYIGTRTC